MHPRFYQQGRVYGSKEIRKELPESHPMAGTPAWRRSTPWGLLSEDHQNALKHSSSDAPFANEDFLIRFDLDTATGIPPSEILFD